MSAIRERFFEPIHFAIEKKNGRMVDLDVATLKTTAVMDDLNGTTIQAEVMRTPRMTSLLGSALHSIRRIRIVRGDKTSEMTALVTDVSRGSVTITVSLKVCSPVAVTAVPKARFPKKRKTNAGKS